LPQKAFFDIKTLLWSQEFGNDSLNIHLNLENYELTSSGENSYFYKSKLSLFLKDTVYTYELKGWIDDKDLSRIEKNTRIDK
jgi:hypothetical protein